MVSDAHKLARRFLHSHPRDAARVLEALPVDQSAALLADVPAETGAALLNAMLARYASQCLAEMPPDKASRALAELNPVTAAIYLRGLPGKSSSAILAKMRRVRATALRQLLRYPSSVVGGWMDSAVFTLPADDTAGEAIARTRREASDLERLIFVVDRDKALLGAVRAAELLRAPSDTPLSSLLMPAPHALSARTSLAAVQQHPGWEEGNPLPVLDREQRFVGVLHFGGLIRGMADGGEDETPELVGSLMELAELSWSGMAQLLDGTFSRLSQSARRRPPDA